MSEVYLVCLSPFQTAIGVLLQRSFKVSLLRCGLNTCIVIYVQVQCTLLRTVQAASLKKTSRSHHGKERDKPGRTGARLGVARVRCDGDGQSEEAATQRHERTAEIPATGRRLE